jgi:hypothetical protein
MIAGALSLARAELLQRQQLRGGARKLAVQLSPRRLHPGERPSLPATDAIAAGQPDHGRRESAFAIKLLAHHAGKEASDHFLQSAAQVRGLATCPQVSFVRFQSIIAEELQLAPEELVAAGCRAAIRTSKLRLID